MSSLDRMIVRPARQEDVPYIVASSVAMALETERRELNPDRLREGTLALLAAPAYGFFLVAERPDTDRQRLIGQLMITYEWSDWRNAAFWWIQSVYVDPAWRRQGVFTRMHGAVLERARADGKVCGVRLYVERDNKAAQAVYQRLGLESSFYVVYEQDFVLSRHPPASEGL